MYKILIVEDDPVIASSLARQLTRWNYEATYVQEFDHVMQEFEKAQPDLVLMDITLPYFSGYYWCAEIRKISRVPIVFLSSAADEMNQVMALSMGADDFIAKPFGMMELVSRVRALLRRTEPEQRADTCDAGPIHVDLNRHMVTVDGNAVTLTFKEFELLCYLMENKGMVLTRDQLLSKIWGYDFDGETRTVDVHIRTLRQKLGEASRCIETIRGVGYKLEESET